MGILRDYNEGRMDDLQKIKYADTGVESPYVTKPFGAKSNEISKRIDDTSRIAQMFVDRPGFKYLANEALLSQVNVEKKIADAKASGQTLAGSLLRQVAGTIVGVTKLALSTLAQVPVNGTGTHFLRGFRTDTYLQDNSSFGSFASFFGAGGVEGANAAKAGEPVPTVRTIDGSVGPTVNTTVKPGDLGIINTGVSGDGITAEDKPITPFIQPEEYINSEGALEQLQPTLESSNPDLMRGTTIPDETEAGIERVTKLIDYRKLDEKGYRSNTYVLNYGSKKINIEKRVGTGSPGKKKTISRGNYTTYTNALGGKISDEEKLDYIDNINMLDVLDTKEDGISAGRDLIKFRFEVITPESSKFLYFRAYLTAFDDSFQGAWNGTKYLGRAEELLTYQGFTRNVNIGFTIAASSRDEMKFLYRKMVYLASSTAPTYEGTNSFMRGTIVRVTVGDYLYEVPGVLESVNYAWQKDYAWEIAMQNPEGGTDDDMQELPHTMDCSLSFRPIHDFVPETGFNPTITNIRTTGNKKPFITDTDINA